MVGEFSSQTYIIENVFKETQWKKKRKKETQCKDLSSFKKQSQEVI